MTVKRHLLVTLVALATAGCHHSEAPAGNDDAANITSVEANAMPENANITEVPADDGDAPAETETNAQ